MRIDVGAVGLEVGAHPRAWRCSAARYQQGVELGVFQGHRTELVGGQIMRMPSADERHAVALSKLLRLLYRRLPDALLVRSQAPLYVDENSQPTPDVAVVDAASLIRPTTAHLVVEILESSSRFERLIKGALYSAVPVPERWLLDTKARVLEFQRDPVEDSLSCTGWRYGWTQVLRGDATVAPLCARSRAERARDAAVSRQTAASTCGWVLEWSGR